MTLVLELIRQAMRLLGLYLVSRGAHSWVGDVLGDPQTAQAVGMAVYGIAETGWLTAKWKIFVKWRAKARARR